MPRHKQRYNKFHYLFLAAISVCMAKFNYYYLCTLRRCQFNRDDDCARCLFSISKFSFAWNCLKIYILSDDDTVIFGKAKRDCLFVALTRLKWYYDCFILHMHVKPCPNEQSNIKQIHEGIIWFCVYAN